MTATEHKSVGGIILPKPFTKMVQIFFNNGNRVTLECGEGFKVTKDPLGKLIGLELDSKSNFEFIRLEEITAIEVVK